MTTLRKGKVRLAIVFTTVTLLSLALIIAFGSLYFSKKDNVYFEATKLLMQFLFVGVFGSVLTLSIQGYQRDREKRATANEFRKSILSKLIRAYSATKKARRIIRSKCLSGSKLSYSVYDEQLKALIDTQLELEILNHEVKTSAKLFERGEDLQNAIEAMEKCLSKVVDEYKDSLVRSDCTPNAIDLKCLPMMTDFLGKTKGDLNFGALFVTPYRNAVEIVRAQILS